MQWFVGLDPRFYSLDLNFNFCFCARKVTGTGRDLGYRKQ